MPTGNIRIFGIEYNSPGIGWKKRGEGFMDFLFRKKEYISAYPNKIKVYT